MELKYVQVFCFLIDCFIIDNCFVGYAADNFIYVVLYSFRSQVYWRALFRGFLVQSKVVDR